MLDLIKLSGEETGVADEFKMDWESQGINFYEDVAYGMGGDHPMYLDLMIPHGKSREKTSCYHLGSRRRLEHPGTDEKIPSGKCFGTGLPYGLCLCKH